MLKFKDDSQGCMDCPKFKISDSGDIECKDGLIVGSGCASHDKHIINVQNVQKKTIKI